MNKNSSQLNAQSYMSSKHISPTHATNEYIANNDNDYLDRNENALGKRYNMLQMQSNSTPSV